MLQHPIANISVFRACDVKHIARCDSILAVPSLLLWSANISSTLKQTILQNNSHTSAIPKQHIMFQGCYGMNYDYCCLKQNCCSHHSQSWVYSVCAQVQQTAAGSVQLIIMLCCKAANTTTAANSHFETDCRETKCDQLLQNGCCWKHTSSQPRHHWATLQSGNREFILTSTSVNDALNKMVTKGEATFYNCNL